MKIFSWKINNFKKIIENENFKNLLYLLEYKYDIICLQEVNINNYKNELLEKLKNEYPFIYNSNYKNNNYKLNIWSKLKPVNIVENFNIELNGRVIGLEFENYILINTIVPETDKLKSNNFKFREDWNSNFFNYIQKIKVKYPNKELIICGDMSVAHNDIDITFPKEKKNKIAGFFDIERSDFAYLLEINDLVDVYREKNPFKKKSSFWNKDLTSKRKHDNGWRLDYFLTSEKILDKIVNYDFLIDMKGSSHCPITIEIE